MVRKVHLSVLTGNRGSEWEAAYESVVAKPSLTIRSHVSHSHTHVLRNGSVVIVNEVSVHRLLVQHLINRAIDVCVNVFKRTSAKLRRYDLRSELKILPA